MAEKTLYEVLGLPSNAKASDIKRAYEHIIAEMQKETVAPDERLRAQAKVAFETLFNPAKRDEYDSLLQRRALMGQSARTRPIKIGVAVVIVVALLGVGYSMWHSRAVEEAAKPKPLPAEQLARTVTPLLWHVDGAMMSGEVRDLGTAIATADGKLVMPCQGLVAGMILTAKAGDFSNTAELSAPNEALGICGLSSKGATAGLKTRSDVPGATEALEAFFVNATGQPETRKVTGVQSIADPAGPALEVKAAVPLPNGAAVFDAFGRLVAIVVAPHAASEGSAFAMSPSRLGGGEAAKAK